jgi:hypothetical protein
MSLRAIQQTSDSNGAAIITPHGVFNSLLNVMNLMANTGGRAFALWDIEHRHFNVFLVTSLIAHWKSKWFGVKR